MTVCIKKKSMWSALLQANKAWCWHGSGGASTSVIEGTRIKWFLRTVRSYIPVLIKLLTPVMYITDCVDRLKLVDLHAVTYHTSTRRIIPTLVPQRVKSHIGGSGKVIMNTTFSTGARIYLFVTSDLRSSSWGFVLHQIVVRQADLFRRAPYVSNERIVGHTVCVILKKTHY